MSSTDEEDDEPSLHPKRLQNPKAKCPRAGRADVNALLKEAWAAGAWIDRDGHQFKVWPPDGTTRMIPVPTTPRSSSGIINKRRQMIRHGIDLDGVKRRAK